MDTIKIDIEEETIEKLEEALIDIAKNG